MVNMIWMDTETDVCVVTHELFSSPVQLLGIVMPLIPLKLWLWLWLWLIILRKKTALDKGKEQI